jgi:hypothetical protein
MLVRWEQVETVLRRGHMVRLCPVCKGRFEPCVAVGIAGVNVLHLLPPILFTEGGLPHYVLTFCGRELEYSMLRLLVESKCADDRRFWASILQRYPRLLYAPLTESVLREVGCDIETEWALWQLAGSE